MNLETIITVLDFLGVAVFAVTGSLSAKNIKLDLFGVIVASLITANGGGTVRDVLLGRTPVFWIDDPRYILVAFLSALVAFYTMQQREPSRRLMLLLDALGLAVFTVIGVTITLESEVSPVIAIIMGVITGTFGGLIRDLLFLQIPLILQREIYATAALSGGLVLVLSLWLGMPQSWAIILSMGVTFGLRVLSLRHNWSLPRIAD